MTTTYAKNKLHILKWRDANRGKYNEKQKTYNNESYYRVKYGISKREYLEENSVKDIWKLFRENI
tara:strand:- start:106 stop:300 length:195 start_codon:yes stop_codon:yes gene_type:complete